jgi:uncharacterized repeat protein (TIGR03803 family)
MMNSAQQRGWFSRLRLQAASGVLAFAVVGSQWAQAQTFKVLHTFHSGKGPQGPSGRLILDKEGNLYGVAGGGTGTCFSNSPCGTVFKMTKTGKWVWVYNFKGPGSDGNEPTGGLLRDATGNLFGVTLYGGVNTNACSSNVPRICGVVYKLDPTGRKETVLHKFTNNPDGMVPESLLIEDSAGNLYGTTLWGGIANDGVVFKVGQAGKYTVLYTFQGGVDGGTDRPGVIWGSPGNLFGVAGYGADNYGVLFEVDARTGTETVLYNFDGNPAGFGSVLIKDAAGNLYGTTEQGGNMKCTYGAGCGVVGELTPHSDGSWTASVLYTFCSLNNNNCADGAYPEMGPLVRDAAGNLYGTTYFGGAANCDGEYLGCGVVFKLDPNSKETILHTFTGGADGAFPWNGLTMDASGNLYGTAQAGGDLNCQPKYGGCGVVFKITP